MEHKKRILIAEDTTLVRRLLMQQLSRELDFLVVGEAENGQDAVRLTFDIRPDVVLMDLEMPVLNGMQATVQILERYPETRVILLTAHEDLCTLGKMAGAADCLSKSCTPSELLAAIRVACVSREDTVTVDSRRNSMLVIERLAAKTRLTDREKAVVHKMVSADDTVSQIAYALSTEWKQKVTESAVKHTIERAMTKLQIEPRTRTAMVKYVMGQMIK